MVVTKHQVVANRGFRPGKSSNQMGHGFHFAMAILVYQRVPSGNLT